MSTPALLSGLKPHRQVLGAATAVLFLAAGLSVVRPAPEEAISSPSGSSQIERTLANVDLTEEEREAVAREAAEQAVQSARSGVRVGAPGADRPGSVIPGLGTLLPGVSDKEIKVVYYWKGDRTMASPYLHGSGQEGNLDEGEAFRHLIAYINKHSDGGATFMGFPFNLHGRKLKGEVLDAGQYPDTYAATAEKIVKQISPFAAISSHGSLSTYICPRLAKAGIHNFGTYDLASSIKTRTNGYCMPSGPSWDAQVEWTVSYLSALAAAEPSKVFGVVYAEYPGLVEAVPPVVEALRQAGVNIPQGGVVSLAADLATAQQQAGSRVDALRRAGVNTVIFPDAGAPMNFTHAAQANGYSPDYYVWPCSGQDVAGMVRLFNAAQWTRASGLTCYDPQYNPDLTNDNQARQSEWYRQYQEVAGRDNEPPAPTPLVYASLMPMLVGITNAGPDLTLENYREGLTRFEHYRYSMIEGRTAKPTNMLVTVGAPDGSFVGDVAKVRWNATAPRPGGATGAYQFPEGHRHSRGARF